MNVFSSSKEYKSLFVSGLKELANENKLGVFILALANAKYDAELWRVFETVIVQRYKVLRETYITEFDDPAKKDNNLSNSEDYLVFKNIVEQGIDQLALTEFRKEGCWALQFNQLRSFRPGRMSEQIPDSLNLPFMKNAFHFNKPFLAAEQIWEGDFHGRKLSLYYNKYPFAPYHTLFVPDRMKEQPQYIDQSMHDYVWACIEQIAENIPEVGMGYNSTGAYASVNHLHFQMFLRENTLPVTYKKWLHNGGKIAYPSSCYVFTDMTQAWLFIHYLHENEITYNLVYLPGTMYCFPRKKQGTYAQQKWNNGFAWYEMAGCISIPQHRDFISLDALSIEQEFRQLTLAV